MSRGSIGFLGVCVVLVFMASVFLPSAVAAQPCPTDALPTHGKADDFYVDTNGKVPTTVTHKAANEPAGAGSCASSPPLEFWRGSVQMPLALSDKVAPPSMHGGASCELTTLRVAGQAGDAYIGPTCNNDETHRTCFYVTGSDFSTNIADYELELDGIAYTPVFFQALSSAEFVLCGTGLPDDTTGVDVTVRSGSACSVSEVDLYDAPDCGCQLNSVRIAGQPGDAYIGPTCDDELSYRTCFYATGQRFPSNVASYVIELDGISYTPAFSQILSATEIVLCATGLPHDTAAVDVLIDAGNSCSVLEPDLFDAPDCGCDIQDIRLGGEPGDAYVGPTCNNDDTYRNCFYTTGERIPDPAGEYYLFHLDDQTHTMAFFQRLSSTEVVSCATGLSPYQGLVDLRIEYSAHCEGTAPLLYDSAEMCSCIADPGEQAACLETAEALLTVNKEVVNSGTGTAEPGDFQLFVDNTPVVSGETNAFQVGSHVVSEAPNGNYAAQIGGDCGPDGSVTLERGDALSCTITNSDIERAQFRVTKTYTDGNPAAVEVVIDCTTGLILEQSQSVAPGESVTFVVTEFDAGELNCEVTEQDIPDGYAVSYVADMEPGASAGAIGGGQQDCTFENVVGGEFSCTITNDVLPVTVTIEKDWVFEGSSDSQSIDPVFELELHCNAEIEGGDPDCDSGTAQQSEPSQSEPSTSCRTFAGEGPERFTARVTPRYPSSSCHVVENLTDDAVEVDNGCTQLTLRAGADASCTVTNTVFFEGIPTLNRQGLLLFSLLLLGVGFASIRRLL